MSYLLTRESLLSQIKTHAVDLKLWERPSQRCSVTLENGEHDEHQKEQGYEHDAKHNLDISCTNHAGE
jgi:hypothetical protein